MPRLSLLASIAGLAQPAEGGMTCLEMKTLYRNLECCGHPETATDFMSVPHPTLRMTGVNYCAGQKALTQPALDNAACFVDAVRQAGEQAGTDVTAGYVGALVSEYTPITDRYYKATPALCPVNVHWHLGAEHRSAAEFDESGVAPAAAPHRRLTGDDETRQGYSCYHYDANDVKFTTPYAWQHCLDMAVGQTYEVHWPHSAIGACGTPYQYQTPFYDGVFCGLNEELLGVLGATPQLIANHVGVQAQVFTIVNDENYFYPDLIRGMLVDSEHSMGIDISAYTGSTTGTSRDNEMCSAYTPITWQVDRKCHLISASSFDKMCADMKQMRDDMSSDLHPHGARELVLDSLSANNQVDTSADDDLHGR